MQRYIEQSKRHINDLKTEPKKKRSTAKFKEKNYTAGMNFGRRFMKLYLKGRPFPGFQKPPPCHFNVLLENSSGRYFLKEINLNTERKLQDPKPYSGLRKFEISGATGRFASWSPAWTQPWACWGLMVPLDPQFTSYGLSPNSSSH